MKFQIIEKPAFDVIGIKRTYSCVDGFHFQAIPKLWLESGSNGTTARICALGDGNPPLGVCLDMDEQAQTISYMIAVQPNANAESISDSSGFERVTIPAIKWAVFAAQGALPHALQSLIGQIYQEWFPISGYMRAAGPDIECYLPGDPNQDDYPFEIWVPIV
jgi:AraC family transcriptional regulator